MSLAVLSLLLLQPAGGLAPDVSQSPIAKQPIAGKLGKYAFRPNVIDFGPWFGATDSWNGKVRDQTDGYQLVFKAVGPEESDLARPFAIVFIDINVSRGEKIAPRTWKWKPAIQGDAVYQSQAGPRAGQRLPRGIVRLSVTGAEVQRQPGVSALFNDRFSTHLKIDRIANGFVYGSMAMVLPDGTPSYMNGTFRARLLTRKDIPL